MLDADDDIDVPISALEHFAYCPRQCGLIHLEQTYEENLYTIRGRLGHERIDSAVESASDEVRSVRSIPLWSGRLGIRGKADLVEFRQDGPYPVEFKSGRRPGAYLRVWRDCIAGSARSPRVLVRTIAAIPVGSFIGRVVAERDIRHVHAHWATHPTTAALVAHSSFSRFFWPLLASPRERIW